MLREGTNAEIISGLGTLPNNGASDGKTHGR